MIAVTYYSEDVRVFIDGTEIKPYDLTMCKCGKTSDYGGHGVKDREVYSEYYCRECYLEKK
jgi:hypothetical protein